MNPESSQPFISSNEKKRLTLISSAKKKYKHFDSWVGSTLIFSGARKKGVAT